VVVDHDPRVLLLLGGVEQLGFGRLPLGRLAFGLHGEGHKLLGLGRLPRLAGVLVVDRSRLVGELLVVGGLLVDLVGHGERRLAAHASLPRASNTPSGTSSGGRGP
jgi:hypothetical protein